MTNFKIAALAALSLLAVFFLLRKLLASIDTVYKQNATIRLMIVFGLIMIAIWSPDLPPLRYAAELGALVMVLGSWIWYETLVEGRSLATDFGFAVPKEEIRHIPVGLAWLALSLAVVFGIGALITPKYWQDPEFLKKLNFVSLGYFIISVPVQEMLMQSYFANQLSKIFPKKEKTAALAAATLFAIAHLPNVILAAGTFVFAFGSVHFFLKRSRNLYLICLAQLLLSHAFKLMVMAPVIGHGCMRVGPIFWNR